MALVWALPVAVVAVASLLPQRGGVAGRAALLVGGFTTHFLIAAAVGVALGLAAVGLGARRVGGVATGVGLVALVAVGVWAGPFWATARAQGLALSPGENLRVAWNSGEPDDARGVVYRTVDGADLRLEVWLPPGRASAPRPAVVWVHGGGWSGGARGGTPAWSAWLAGRGYAVFDLDYRLAPPPRWRDANDDVRCAIGWVQARAAEYGVDPGAIMVAGGSAGGNLALVAAYAPGDAATPAGCAPVARPVAAVFAIHPITDAAAWWATDAGGRATTERFAGGTPADYPDRFAAISPLRAVRPGLPPTLITHGTADRVVPYAQSRALAEALSAAGVPATFLSLPRTDHGYDGVWNGFATQLTRGALAAFLERHLPVPPARGGG